mgnify:CR=1 FL=1
MALYDDSRGKLPEIFLLSIINNSPPVKIGLNEINCTHLGVHLGDSGLTRINLGKQGGSF